MAKIRSIHPDTCESSTLATLSAHAERTFWRLLPHTDDYGRGKYAPVVLRNKLYMASPDVPVEQVDADLDELREVGLIQVYENAGRRFYHVRSWDEFQKPKHKADSKFPAPDDPGSTPVEPDPDPTGPDSDPTGVRTPPRRVSGGLVEVESSLSDPSPAGAGVGDSSQAAESGADDAADDGAPDEVDAAFEEFWEVYPPREGKKKGKGNARIEFRKLTKAQRDRAMIGAKHLAASGEMPKDAERFLRRPKGGKGDFPFDDWQEPADTTAGQDPDALLGDRGYVE